MKEINNLKDLKQQFEGKLARSFFSGKLFFILNIRENSSKHFRIQILKKNEISVVRMRNIQEVLYWIVEV